jgi:hypothetical protein
LSKKIVPLVAPFSVWSVDTAFFFEVEKSTTKHAFAARHWNEALDLVDAALGVAPPVVPLDLDQWLREIGNLASGAVADQRYKRLLRLTQR